MNQWLLGAVVLAVCLVPCAGVAFYAGPLSGLAALQVAGGLTTSILILLSESFRRQPFIDLAVAFAALTVVGGIIFARILERDL
ncbi:MAG TPA: monovalent cation/H+ antiporter complex subunit F [Thermoleophilaceae bacterium]|jgi:multisubunit Na+/H+ antiporter MnhF subunit|nr:monovalent cation/H+ antiporter complex subunit F [Thermoleophilaceae bacterium]